jgi:penicillin-binding protein 1C
VKVWACRALAALAALLSPVAALLVAACFQPLPSSLSPSTSRTHVLVTDRDGRLLREVAVGSGVAESPVSLDELSPWVVPSLLAAEDARFYRHPGVDPVAVTRALGQVIAERRVVSGASTLTQQLARTLVPRPRSLLGKLREMALALRIEASLSKRRILEEYLSRVEFGPGLVGLQAASRSYFRKSAGELDLSEAAALVSMPRGPSLYDPRRRPQLLERRRLRVLSRLGAMGLATPAEIARAELTPMRFGAAARASGAEHLSFALATRYATEEGAHTRSLRTTLDAALQREAERIAEAALPSLDEHGGDAISLIALDNESGDVLAYVGSPSYFDVGRDGANDGVVARRQPGSTLKPFVYATAMAELGYGPSTLLPDLPRDYEVPGGTFAPRNYDQRFRGPVLLRQALGSSLNMPALEVASRVGPARLLQTLRRFGFASLERDASHYGVGLALGDGEVTLLELATAYSALARGGELRPSRLVLGRSFAGRGETRSPSASPVRVLRPELAALLTDMLSDDAARASGFGRDSVLSLPFPVAAKTGTSKGYRDNWAVGYTREVTVAVWVGNFDGAPLRDASGITAAGPAFHDLMLGAMRGRAPAPLFDRTLLTSVEVCTVSGGLPGAACAHRRREQFARGHEPTAGCELHVLTHVDALGREQDARCGGEERVRERYPLEYRAWAERAGRPLLGRSVSPTCAPAAEPTESRVTFPREGQRFAIDPDGPPRQELVLTAASSAQRVRFVIDGASTAELGLPFRLPWRLSPGSHRVAVEVDGVRSEPVRFDVSGP